MSYKNSVKLLTSNFSLVWKQLLYMLVTSLAIIGIVYGVAHPIITTLRAEGVLADFSAFFEKIYTSPKDVFSTLSNSVNHLSEVLSHNIGNLWVSMLFTVLFGVVINSILKNISLFNISNIMYMKMTSFTQVGYFQSLVSTSLVGLRFSLAKFVLKIPISSIKILILYGFFSLVSTPLSVVLGLFIVILLLTLITTFELTIFSAMAGELLSKKGLAFKAFFSGCTHVFKKFWRIFSNSIITILTLMLVNLFLGIFTFGAALLVTLPASYVFVAIFELANYFGARKERYYISNSIIVTPLGEENKID